MKLLRHFIFLIAISSLMKCSDLKEDLNEVKYQNPIKIGFLGPFSEVRMGAEGKYLGAYLAAEEINAAGGILGRDIQIVPLNDGGSAEIGIKAATQLYNEGIRVILGADWSSVTLGVATSFTIPKNMLLMSYSSTNPEISQLNDKDLVWRTCPSDVFQGKVGAVYCRNYLHKQTAAILAMNNPWSLDLAKTFQSNFENLGGTITHFGIYPELLGDAATKYDFTSHLDSLFEAKPEIIYLAAFPSDGAKITNDIAKNNYLASNYNPIFFSNDGLYSNYFLINAHVDIIDNFFGTVPGASRTNSNYNQYFNKYATRWGFEPVAFSEYAYDAMYLIAYSILSNNGSAEPLQISTFLRNISGTGNNVSATIINVNEFDKARDVILSGGKIDYNGASGNIEFDLNGDPGSGTYLIWNIKNGEYVTDTLVTFP